MKVDVKKEESVQIVSYFEDFDGDLRRWQESYFTLLAWKNTWDAAYVLDLNSSRTKGTFVRVIPRNADTMESVKEMMDELGYRKLQTFHVSIGVAEYCDVDEIVLE